MTLAADREADADAFAVEDISTGVHASGFGQLGDGRSFSFHVERQQLVVEIYRPAASRPGAAGRRCGRHRQPQPADIDLDDERSLAAAVRDAVAGRSAGAPPGALTVPAVIQVRSSAWISRARMSWLQVVVLSVVQGLTEFLPVSSSGHLAIVSRVFFAGDAGASFTAVSQLGTEAAVLVYFARDIGRILKAWFNGLFVKAHRDNADYRMGWYVIIGTIPIVRARSAVQGRHPQRRPQSLDRRHRPAGVLGRDRRRRVLRQADPP